MKISSGDQSTNSNVIEHAKKNEREGMSIGHHHGWLWHYRMLVLVTFIFGWKKAFYMVMIIFMTMAIGCWCNAYIVDTSDEDGNELIEMAVLEKLNGEQVDE